MAWLGRREIVHELGGTGVSFTFSIEAQGPMAPMINAMLAPYAQQVAEKLLDTVAEHLEGSDPPEPR